MNVKKTIMTVEGERKLRDRLHYLEQEVRPSIIKALGEARALGDLSENSDYQAAKEEQALTERRIYDIKMKLQHAQVIDISKIPNHGRVIFGSTVTFSHTDTKEEITYRIVGTDEADAKQGTISLDAPLARAAIGKELNDYIVVNTLDGAVEYEIVKVVYQASPAT